MIPRPQRPSPSVAIWLGPMALAALAAVVGCGRDSETQRLLGRHLLESGLAIELVAAEPLVFDPVDLEFDEHGHAFVLEMPGFPLVSEDQPRPGRVVELVDEDGDGRFDRRLPFADGFRYADSILPYRGGLLVADAPDLVYLKDTDGDGQADLRQVVISGFGLGPSESLFNGLRHGLDNWIYAANGSSGGDVFLVFPAGHPESPVSIRGQDVRFRFRSDPADPQRLGDGELERAGRTGGGFGLDFDDWGRRFVTHEQRHIQAAIIPERYLARGHTWPSTTVEISDHGQDEGARVFPISAPEARPNHPEQAGHFTAGCGLTRWAGGILPPGLEGSFFVAEAVHHLVHRDVVEADGAGFRARRATARSESLAVADPWSRPVNFALGPNGALYLLDMQRAVIEHPEWIPDELERDLDLRAGEDRGRIYRLTAAGATGAEAEPLATSREGWLGELGHKNAWRRYTAQRLLVEAGDTETPARLRALLAASPSPLAPLAQLHILWTLDGLGALEPLDLITAFSAIEPGLRENALILAEHFLVRDRDLRQLTITLARDPDPRVRLQALLSLSTLPLQTADPNDPDGPDDADVLSAIAAQALLDDRDDPWIRIAALNLASADPFAVLERCCTGDAGNGAPSPEAVAGLARLIGEGVRDGGVADTVAAVAARLFNGSGDGALALAVLDGLAGGLETRPAASSDRRSASAAVVAALGPLLDHPEPAIAAAAARIARAEGIPPTAAQLQRARSAALSASDSTLPTEGRLDALALLATLDLPERAPLLVELLDVSQPEPLQRAALAQLAPADDPTIARLLVAQWSHLGPAVRERAGDLLIYRPRHQPVLLDALESGELPIGELNFHLERRRALLRSRDPEVRERSSRLLSDLEVSTRAEEILRLEPALALRGRVASGRERFLELCARCHRLGTIGAAVGPDLTALDQRSAVALLHDIIDPNAAVSPEYLSFVVETTSGEVLSGLLLTAEEDQVVLRAPESDDRRIARSEIAAMRSAGTSLMPEGLETFFRSPQEFADLVAFLQQPR